MAHTAQDRYSKLVDAKLRATIVKKDGVFWNTKYEGDPKAGSVKIPVRDTEVSVQAYNKATGVSGTTSTTTYLSLSIDKDYAVNEIIDGFDAASVPDGITAERLDSAGYSMALQCETDGTTALMTGGTVMADTAAITKSNVYEKIVDTRTAMSNAKVPDDGRRVMAVSPAVYACILKSPEFISASDLGDNVKQTGALGKIAGFLIFEDTSLDAKVDWIACHPEWCHHVNEWAVPCHVQDLNGSGTYIGASAVQGRNVYGYKVSKAKAVQIKKNAT